MAAELRGRVGQARLKGCVLSFPSTVVLPAEHIAAAWKALIRVVYLYGSAAHCIDAFLKRERSSGRNLGLDHWLLNNIEKYMQMSKPEFEPYRTHVFTVRGGRRSHAAVLGDIQKK